MAQPRTESVEIRPDGIWIQTEDGDLFRFSGPVEEFFSIMVAHPELSIEGVRFFVRDIPAEEL